MRSYHDERSSASLLLALTYSFAVSSLFVGSLYLLLPSDVRLLDRNDPRHIKWRAAATAVACFASVALFDFTFLKKSPSSGLQSSPSVLRIVLPLGINSVVPVFIHSAVLYTGPILQGFVESVDTFKKSGQPFDFLSFASFYCETTIASLLAPLFSWPGNPFVRWMCLRNFIIAPVAEEIVFRGCIVSALKFAGMSNVAVSWISPLFFGIAHLHHAVLRLAEKGDVGNTRDRARLWMVVGLQTGAQFAYTTLFGAYASFAFIRTNSLLAIIGCHSFCNIMGLPNLHFISPSSSAYEYRWTLGFTHIVGIAGFVYGFRMLTTA
jgi:prenyl protein peptidase